MSCTSAGRRDGLDERQTRAARARALPARAGRGVRERRLGRRQATTRSREEGRHRPRMAAVHRGRTRRTRPGRHRQWGEARAPSALLVVHISEDSPAILQGAGPISDETAERLTCDASRLLIQPVGDDIVYRYEGRTASTPQKLAMLHRSGHCQYPGCTSDPRPRSPPRDPLATRRQDTRPHDVPALPAASRLAARARHHHQRHRRRPRLHQRRRPTHHRQPTTRPALLK